MIHPAAICNIAADETAIEAIIELSLNASESEVKDLVFKAFPPPEISVEATQDLTREIKRLRGLLDLAALCPKSPQVETFLAKRSTDWETMDRESIEAMKGWLLTGLNKKPWDWIAAAASCGKKIPARYPWSHPTLACWRAKTPTPTTEDFKNLEAALARSAGTPHTEDTHFAA